MSASTSKVPHHYCIAVPDLEAAADYFARTIGVQFTPARELTIRAVGDLGGTYQVRFAFSEDRYLELLETVPGDGIFGDGSTRGFHHVGYRATTSLDEAIAEAVSGGEKLELELYVGEMKIAAFFSPTPTRPVRLELVSPSVASLPQ